MAEPLSGREYQSLRRRVHRHVGGLLNLVQSFEVLPHRVRGVGQASVGEGVGGEQVTEFIFPARSGHAQNRDERGAKKQG